MATERQIQANRANAAKSTGPVTPEGKRVSSKNATLSGLLSGTVVLNGESKRRFDDLAAALTDQFQPRNYAETALLHTMIASRWRLLRLWGIQTAGFQTEMVRTQQNDSSAASGAVLAALTFRSLADNSRVLTVQNRCEATYDRQFNQALITLLKLRATPDASFDSSTPVGHSFQFATETWEAEAETEPNFQPESEEYPKADE